MLKVFIRAFICFHMTSWAVPAPKYPIVLVHGLLGGNHLGIQDYWSDIPTMLREKGALVYIAELEQTAPSLVRGKRLVKLLKRWGHDKYNLIGHSQGGIDARYVLAHASDKVASVTTISSPHYGSKVADWIYSEMKSNFLKRKSANLLGNVVGQAVGLMNGHWYRQDFEGAIKSLTTKGMTKFNIRYPIGIHDTSDESTKVKLYSFGSDSDVEDGVHDALGFLIEHIGEKVYRNTNNDGLVSVDSMKFGTWLGVVEHAHHAMIVGGTASPVSDEEMQMLDNIYLHHAQRLFLDGC